MIYFTWAAQDWDGVKGAIIYRKDKQERFPPSNCPELTEELFGSWGIIMVAD